MARILFLLVEYILIFYPEVVLIRNYQFKVSFQNGTSKVDSSNWRLTRSYSTFKNLTAAIYI